MKPLVAIGLLFFVFLVFSIKRGSGDRVDGSFNDETSRVKRRSSRKGLKIAAFNIQIFGRSKAKKTKVMASLVKILTRYDIIFVQEIRDKSQKSLPKLVKQLNEIYPYKYKVSERLGRTSSKEQYAYVYRSDRVKITATYQAPDTKDIFQREPYAARFYSYVSDLRRFVMIGIHTAPKDAVKEIDHLDDVYDKVVKEWGIKDAIIAGDYNADCNYVRKSKWKTIDMWTDKRFTWLIDNDADTTVKTTNCAYDRFVVTGRIKDNVVPKSVKVYRYDTAQRLSYKEAKAVSDHYPIELILKS